MKITVRVRTNLSGFTTATVTASNGDVSASKTRKLSSSQLSSGVVQLKADTVEMLAVTERALA